MKKNILVSLLFLLSMIGFAQSNVVVPKNIYNTIDKMKINKDFDFIKGNPKSVREFKNAYILDYGSYVITTDSKAETIEVIRDTSLGQIYYRVSVMDNDDFFTYSESYEKERQRRVIFIKSGDELLHSYIQQSSKW